MGLAMQGWVHKRAKEARTAQDEYYINENAERLRCTFFKFDN